MNLSIHDVHDPKKNYHQDDIFWRSEECIEKSLDHILEKKKKIIKIKYLEIINEIIEKNKINNLKFKYKNIHLLDVSLVNEKNPYKSKKIYDCLKLLALEDFIKIKKIKKIKYNGKNKNIDFSLAELCHAMNIEYKKKYLLNLQSFKILFFIKGLFFLIYFILKNFKKHKIKKHNAKLIFFSYLQHLKNKSFFDSAYWNGLNKILKKKKIHSNWFHFFIPSLTIPSISMANNKINLFNANSKFERHFIINSYIDLKHLLKIIYIYIKFFLLNFFLINKKFFFKNTFSNTNFSHFFYEDLSRSLYGDILIYNLFNIISLDNILKKIPKQKCGFYLMENQSWEIILNRLWRIYDHGKIYGFIHSSIRFWDLRYFSVKKNFYKIDQYPDVFLFNSSYYKKIAIQNNYPMNKCKVVEALRYIDIKKKKLHIKQNKKVLIVGDINNEENNFLLKKITRLICKLKNYSFYYKPHPANTTNMILKLKKISKKINFLKSTDHVNYNNFETIVCSNGTSAVIDCLINKLKFCTIKSNDTIDMFAFDDKIKSKIQLSNDNEIISFIKKNFKYKQNILDLDLNESLIKWKKIIQSFKYN